MKKSKFPVIYLTILTVLLYLPILIVIVYSFNESKISSIWGGLSLRWYRDLFADRSIREAVFNSIFLGVSSSVIAAAVSVSAALAFRRQATPLSRLTVGASMLPIMIPEIILGMAFLAFFRLLHLPFGMLTLIIAHTTFCIPYIYMQVSTRIVSMDPSINDAARDLGAGPIRAFWDVTLPHLMPAVASGMFLAFAMSFDDVVISVFVTGVTVNTLPVKIYTQIKTGVTPKINALCTLILAVTVLCTALSFIFLKKNKIIINGDDSDET